MNKKQMKAYEKQLETAKIHVAKQLREDIEKINKMLDKRSKGNDEVKAEYFKTLIIVMARELRFKGMIVL